MIRRRIINTNYSDQKHHKQHTRINRTAITRKQKMGEKQLYGYFKRQISKISPKKTWTWLRKGNLKR